jgi:hypothetical protein
VLYQLSYIGERKPQAAGYLLLATCCWPSILGQAELALQTSSIQQLTTNKKFWTTLKTQKNQQPG